MLNTAKPNIASLLRLSLSTARRHGASPHRTVSPEARAFAALLAISLAILSCHASLILGSKKA
jgi:hypothetical protein